MSSSSSPPPESERILFAVPKKGRLYERVVKILEGAGLHYSRAHRLDVADCKSLPVTLVFLPAADIAKYVSDGQVDLGITGQDIIAESEADVEVLQKLEMGKCRLCVQAPVAANITDVKALCGKRIVTSFPRVTEQYFRDLDADNLPSIRYVTGSVEVACKLGLADAIVDLVETGTTMRAAGLEAIADVMRTETVLIANKQSLDKSMVKKLNQRIEGFVTATQMCMVTFNCHKDKLEEASSITPGHEAPTVTQLALNDWLSVSALVRKKELAHIMDELKEIGAMSILATEISNCRF